jgi:hypothetical protein
MAALDRNLVQIPVDPIYHSTNMDDNTQEKMFQLDTAKLHLFYISRTGAYRVFVSYEKPICVPLDSLDNNQALEHSPAHKILYLQGGFQIVVNMFYIYFAYFLS